MNLGIPRLGDTFGYRLDGSEERQQGLFPEMEKLPYVQRDLSAEYHAKKRYAKWSTLHHDWRISQGENLTLN